MDFYKLIISNNLFDLFCKISKQRDPILVAVDRMKLKFHQLQTDAITLV